MRTALVRRSGKDGDGVSSSLATVRAGGRQWHAMDDDDTVSDKGVCDARHRSSNARTINTWMGRASELGEKEVSSLVG